MPEESLSFAGCGFLGIYHIGCAAAIKKHAPHLVKGRLLGASAGTLAAAGLLCDIPAEEMTSSVIEIAMEARRRLLGPFSPSFHVDTLLRDGMYDMFPEDAHIRVSGKIQISVTRVWDRKNVLLTHFNTKDELITALLCSSFIPGFSGWLPHSFDGVRYIDGGFSDNLPHHDDNTITVSPFAGEAKISPVDGESSTYTLSLFGTSLSMSMENLHRLSQVMLPPAPEVLHKMCRQGYTDTLEFLINHNIINSLKTIPSHEIYNQDLPEEVAAVFKELIDSEMLKKYPAKVTVKDILSLQLANVTCFKFLETNVHEEDSNYTYYTRNCLAQISNSLNWTIDNFAPDHQRAMDRFYEAYDRYGMYSILTSYTMLSFYGILGAYICLQERML
ncbi:unnamed protein product, partial [Meganyctiphanes norvegica]